MVGIKSTARSVARRFGYDIVAFSTPSSVRRARLLGDARIDTVIDVGAYQGDYVAGFRRQGFTGTAISIEADPDRAQQLRRRTDRDPCWQVVAAGADERSDVVPLHRASNGQSSSFLKLGDAHLAAAPNVTQAEDVYVRVDRLDSLVEEGGLEWNRHPRCWVKIDVQGRESAVLAGATRLLASTAVLEVEVSFRPLYEAQPPFHSLISQLDSLGFFIVGMTPVFEDSRSSHLLQADALLCNRSFFV